MTATHERQGHQRSEPIVRDEVVRLGSEGQLVGIVSHPAEENTSARPNPSNTPNTLLPGTRGLGFVILNAGVLHRVGPHRLHVLLARRLAQFGLAGLRLDLGGVGDSIASSDAANFRDSAVADTQLAMTSLTGMTAAKRFLLFGVCSGADNSIATALADQRVAGIVLVDPPVYPTRRAQLRHLRARVAKSGGPGELMRWGLGVAERRLRRLAARLGQRAGAAQEDDDTPSQGRELPSVAAFGTQLTTLADRGVRIFAVYSGIHGVRYNHADQLFELYPALRGRIDHVYYPTANHTFTELDAQTKLIDAVTSWMTKRFG